MIPAVLTGFGTVSMKTQSRGCWGTAFGPRGRGRFGMTAMWHEEQNES